MKTFKLIVASVCTYAVVMFLMFILIRSMYVFPLTFVERFHF